MNATDQVFFAVVVFIVVQDIDDFRSSSLVPESPVLLPALIFVEPRRSRLLPGHGQQTVFSLKSFPLGLTDTEVKNEKLKPRMTASRRSSWQKNHNLRPNINKSNNNNKNKRKEKQQQSCQTRTKLKWPNDDWLFAFMRVTQGLRLIGGPLVTSILSWPYLAS